MRYSLPEWALRVSWLAYFQEEAEESTLGANVSCSHAGCRAALPRLHAAVHGHDLSLAVPPRICPSPSASQRHAHTEDWIVLK